MTKLKAVLIVGYCEFCSRTWISGFIRIAYKQDLFIQKCLSNLVFTSFLYNPKAFNSRGQIFLCEYLSCSLCTLNIKKVDWKASNSNENFIFPQFRYWNFPNFVISLFCQLLYDYCLHRLRHGWFHVCLFLTKNYVKFEY